MTAGEIKALAAGLEAQARALAANLEAAGEAPDAPEDAFVVAELAGLIIKLAEKRATLVWRDDVDEQLQELRNMEADMAEAIEAEMLGAVTLAAAHTRADVAVQHAIAKLDVAHEKVLARLAERALAAWQRAALELEGLAPRAPATEASS